MIKKKNNGVLILATFGQGEGNNDVVISVGQGLEGALPDGKLGRILDSAFYPYASTGEIGKAFQTTYAEVFQTVAQEYNWDGDKLSNKKRMNRCHMGLYLTYHYSAHCHYVFIQWWRWRTALKRTSRLSR